jgi:hypothetical protein
LLVICGNEPVGAEECDNRCRLPKDLPAIEAIDPAGLTYGEFSWR